MAVAQQDIIKRWNGNEYVITHRCGHSTVKRLLDPTVYQQRRSAKFLATLLCYECLVNEGTLKR